MADDYIELDHKGFLMLNNIIEVIWIKSWLMKENTLR